MNKKLLEEQKKLEELLQIIKQKLLQQDLTVQYQTQIQSLEDQIVKIGQKLALESDDEVITLTEEEINCSHWYTDEDMNAVLQVCVRDLGVEGFQENKKFLLAGIGANNDYPEDGEDRRYKVLLVDAVDTREVSTPITFFFDHETQPAPDAGNSDHRQDIFSELEELFEQSNINIKILFPYNRTNQHWLLGEIKIFKQDNNYNIHFYAHDPYGSGQMDADNYAKFCSCFRKKLPANVQLKFNNEFSPYNSRRQAVGDGTSCGVIAIEELLKRAAGGSLEQKDLYPVGALALRKKHLNNLKEFYRNDLSNRTLANYTERNLLTRQGRQINSPELKAIEQKQIVLRQKLLPLQALTSKELIPKSSVSSLSQSSHEENKKTYQEQIDKVQTALNQALAALENKSHALHQLCKSFLQQLLSKVDTFKLELENFVENNIFQLMDIQQRWQLLQDDVQDQINEIDLVTPTLDLDKSTKAVKDFIFNILGKIKKLFSLLSSVEMEFYEECQQELIRKLFTGLEQQISQLTKNKSKSKCFISYAWGVTEHERLAEKLADHLKLLGVEVWIDRCSNPVGSFIDYFTTNIDEADYVILLGSRKLLAKYNEGRKLYEEVKAKRQKLDSSKSTNTYSNYIVNLELHHIFTKDLKSPGSIIPLLLDGTLSECLPPNNLQNIVPVHFAGYRQIKLFSQKVLELLAVLLPNELKGLPKQVEIEVDRLMDILAKYVKTKDWQNELQQRNKKRQSKNDDIIKEIVKKVISGAPASVNLSQSKPHESLSEESSPLALLDKEVEKDLKQAEQGEKIAKNVLDQLGNPQNQSAEKNRTLLERYARPIFKTIDRTAELISQIQQIDLKGPAFEDDKKAVIDQFEQKMKKMGFSEDIVRDCYARNRYLNLTERRDYLTTRFTEAIYLNYSKQKETYANVKIELTKIREQIRANENFKSESLIRMDQLKQTQQQIISDFKKLRYGTLLPIAQAGFNFASNLSGIFNNVEKLNSLNPEPISRALFSAAAFVIGIVASHKQNETLHEQKEYQDLIKKKEMLRDCYQTQQVQLNQEMKGLLAVRDKLQKLAISHAESDKCDQEIQTALDDCVNEFKSLEGEVKQLEQKVDSLTQQYHVEIINIPNQKDKMKAKLTLADIQAQRLRNQIKYQHVLRELEDCKTAIAEVEKLKRIEEKLKPVKAFFEKQLEEKGFHRLSEQEETLFKINLLIKQQFVQYQELFTEQDQVVTQSGNELYSTAKMIGQIADRLNYPNIARLSHCSSTIIHGAMLTYRAGRLINTLCEHSSPKFLNLLKHSEGALSTINKFGKLQMATEFLNPTLGLVQLSGHLANLVSTSLWGVELFPDPVMVQLKDIQSKIEQSSEQIKKELGDKIDDIKEMLAETHAKTELSLATTIDVKEVLNQYINKQAQYVLKKQDEKVIRKIQELRLNVINIIHDPGYFTTGAEQYFVKLFKLLEEYSMQVCSSNFNNLYCDTYVYIIDNPWHAVNLIAKTITLNSEINPNKLANYQILNSVVKIALQAHKNFIERLSTVSSAEAHAFKKAKLKIESSITEINQILQNLYEFVESLSNNYKKWIPELRENILHKTREILSIFDKQKIEDLLLDRELRHLQETKESYLQEKYRYWKESWYVKDQTICQHVKEQFSPIKSFEAQQINLQKDDNTIESMRHNLEQQIQDSNLQIHLSSKTLQILFQKNSAQSISPSTSNYNAGAITTDVNINKTPVTLQLLQHLFRKSNNDPKTDDKLNAHIRDYLGHIGHILKIYEKDNRENIMPYQFEIKPNQFFPGEGVLIFHHLNNLMPLVFPKELLTKIRDNYPRVQAIFEAERVGVGAVTIEYIFEPDRTGKNYHLMLRYGCRKVHTKIKLPLPCVDICIASFDHVTVHAHMEVKFDEDKYEIAKLNYNKFLIIAMYGSFDLPVGLAGIDSCDLRCGIDTQEYKSLSSIIIVPVVGLFQIWKKQPICWFIFDHHLYTPTVFKKFNQWIKDDVQSNIIMGFLGKQYYEYEASNYAEIEDNIRLAKKNIFHRVKDKLSEVDKRHYAQCFEEISKYYEVIVGAIHLFTNLSYQECAEILAQHLALSHPYFLKVLYERDLEKFLVQLRQFDQKVDADKLILRNGNLFEEIKRQRIALLESLNTNVVQVEVTSTTKNDDNQRSINLGLPMLPVVTDNSRLTYLTEIYKKIDSIIGLDPSIFKMNKGRKKILNTEEVLSTPTQKKIKLVVFTPEASLLNNDIGKKYQYNFLDICRVTNYIREKILKTSQVRERIFLATPCLVENFIEQLDKDTKRFFDKNNKWIMLIYPIHKFYGLCVTYIQINYHEKEINIKWYDPLSYKSAKNNLEQENLRKLIDEKVRLLLYKHELDNSWVLWSKSAFLKKYEISTNFRSKFTVHPHARLSMQVHIREVSTITLGHIEKCIKKYAKHTAEVEWLDLNNVIDSKNWTSEEIDTLIKKHQRYSLIMALKTEKLKYIYAQQKSINRWHTRMLENILCTKTDFTQNFLSSSQQQIQKFILNLISARLEISGDNTTEPYTDIEFEKATLKFNEKTHENSKSKSIAAQLAPSFTRALNPQVNGTSQIPQDDLDVNEVVSPKPN